MSTILQKKIGEKKFFFKELKGGFRKIRGLAQKRSSLLAVSLLTEPGEDTVKGKGRLK